MLLTVSFATDEGPGHEEELPDPEEVRQPPSLDVPDLVGSALHLRHLLQDEVPPVHPQPEVAR